MIEKFIGGREIQAELRVRKNLEQLNSNQKENLWLPS